MIKTSAYFTSLVCCLALGACADESFDEDASPEPLVDSESEHGVVEISTTQGRVSGVFHHSEAELRFESEVAEGASWVTVELRGMVLLLTADRETGAFDVDGFTLATGEDTQMSAADRAVLHDFDLALGAYAGDSERGPALDVLFHTVTAWTDYASSLPLQRTFHGRLDRSSNLCSSVNKPGQGTTIKYVAASHDCGSTKGDCSNWVGCDFWDDNSTTDKVAMSMSPTGSCSDDTYFGGSTTGMSCHEPDHPGGKEYAYGQCFGRCGAGCGSNTQFTRDCLDHDQCVRLGHGIASGWCNDHLVGATWDALNASNCSGVKFDVDRNWAGGPDEGNCPTSRRNANDGCDHGCQFIDGDCFR